MESDNPIESGTSLMHRLRRPSFLVLVLLALGLVAAFWIATAIVDFVADINFETLDRPYVLVAFFVMVDAVIPIFPSESLLNTGSILAMREGSPIEIWKLIVAGSIGAIFGDSLLYWISRTALRNFMSKRVDNATQNEKVAEAVTVMSGQAPLLIVFGRFIPGVRFVVGATMGITRHPYPNFLLWDVVGSVVWASFACISSAAISTALGGQPLVSIIISAIATTALLGVLYKRMKQSLQDLRKSDNEAMLGSDG